MAFLELKEEQQVMDVLKLRGFKNVSRGWIKDLENSTQLHALTYKNTIELHLDEPHPEDKTRHKSRKFSSKVMEEKEQMYLIADSMNIPK